VKPNTHATVLDFCSCFWDENAGLRRDAIGSQVIDALEAQGDKETGNEED
jgi:hypothetical protein